MKQIQKLAVAYIIILIILLVWNVMTTAVMVSNIILSIWLFIGILFSIYQIWNEEEFFNIFEDQEIEDVEEWRLKIIEDIVEDKKFHEKDFYTYFTRKYSIPLKKRHQNKSNLSIDYLPKKFQKLSEIFILEVQDFYNLPIYWDSNNDLSPRGELKQMQLTAKYSKDETFHKI